MPHCRPLASLSAVPYSAIHAKLLPHASPAGEIYRASLTSAILPYFALAFGQTMAARVVRPQQHNTAGARPLVCCCAVVHLPTTSWTTRGLNARVSWRRDTSRPHTSRTKFLADALLHCRALLQHQRGFPGRFKRKAASLRSTLLPAALQSTEPPLHRTLAHHWPFRLNILFAFWDSTHTYHAAGW